ncbi:MULTISPECIES: type II and III secretion system protein family protein [unclassified Duganella]|uniref:type II and III secretion system protein family protein n=1 Tax=unclassified Duganella TaxID=2636909 RepID=UPI000880D97E|nr:MULTISPECIES: type II and III secretion system protein family protein [unclassified Duganella]SDG94923.1 pilus assembly protein CpaC [Duganella sp. OV458]SDJ47557.1 pilus assembly protein CpaC [Duganella sp. OV510]
MDRHLHAWALCAALTLAAPLRAAPVAAQPRPEPAPADSGSLRCTGQAAQPINLTLQPGKSTLMRMPETVQARSIGNPAVLQAMLVAPDTLYVVGVDIGSSNMIVQGRSGLCNVVEVIVGIDPGALQQALAALMPEQKDIHVSAAGDTLVISGTVDDAPTAARVLELATAFVRRPAQPLALDGKRSEGTSASAQSASSAAAQASARIVNFLNVGAPQQVMLEVKIAEVSKSLLDKLEANVSLRFGGGSWASSLTTSLVSDTLKGLLRIGSRGAIAADKKDALVRMLAEPTVMAVSGQEGSFLAGGRILVPVAQDNNKVTLDEKEFGVGLRFTPTVLAGGRINLRVAPEVSEISREGIGISAAGFSGTAVLPLFTTRRASTTVELYDGQSFAIGGLIRNSQSSNIHGLPILGELPVLGALFRSTDFQQDRTELLFVVTPHLVRPLPANYQLPTDSVTTPGRTSLFLGGRMEGAPEPSSKE